MHHVRSRWVMNPAARLLTFLTTWLLLFGCAALYSASAVEAVSVGLPPAHYLMRQLVGVVLGVVLFMVAAKSDSGKLEALAWLIMGISLATMLITILPFTESIAPRIHGSRRFLIGSSFQPSEFAKLGVVIWTAMLAVRKGERLRGFVRGMLPFLVVIGALDLAAVLEPDLSTAMFYTLIMAIMLYVGGVRLGHFVLLGLLSVPFLYHEIERLQYVLLRMTSFWNPGAPGSEHVGYQLQQSLISVGSGGIFGVGFLQGHQQYGFLPFPYSDFIAGSIGEEWGFLGIAVLTLSFAAYGYLGFKIAENARSPFLKLVAVGLTTTTVITAFLHIGVCIGLLPTTGLTLPFLSFGRSNLVLSLAMTGILVNIGSRHERAWSDTL